MLKRANLLPVLLLPLIHLGTQNGHAQSQTWGTSVSATPDLVRMSDGSNMPSTTVWTLGWFDDGFVPDTANYMQWADRYNEVDRDFFLLQGGFYTVSGDSPGTSPEAQASVGKQMWVFAFNNISLIGTPSGEALLYTDGPDRRFPGAPNAGIPTFDIADGPMAADNDFSVIWGRVDRNAYGAGGVQSGGGIMSADPGDGTTGNFEAQMATFVPEPGSAMLLLLAASALLGRGNRR